MNNPPSSTQAPRRRVAVIGAGPGALCRDRAVFDHTPFLEAMLVDNYLKDAETQMETLPISTHWIPTKPNESM